MKRLRAMTPLLTVLIGGVGLALSGWYNVVQYNDAKSQRKIAEDQVQEAHRQNDIAQLQKVDSDWREALEKGIGNEQSAALIVVLMESFAGEAKYKSHANAIAYAVLPSIKSEFEFDEAFNGVLDLTTKDNEDSLVSVVQKLSLRLEKLHDKALKENVRHPRGADLSLAAFVNDPEPFFDKDGDSLGEANAIKWKLDTASVGLVSLWKGTPNRKALPVPEELSGLILLNRDFRGLDFSKASMKQSFFLGGCKVDAEKLPKEATAICTAE